MTPEGLADAVRALTPQQLADLIGGRVEAHRDPWAIPCPTCGQPAYSRCRRQGTGRPGRSYSGTYDGPVTYAHPKRVAATPSGVRVVGPIVPVAS